MDYDLTQSSTIDQYLSICFNIANYSKSVLPKSNLLCLYASEIVSGALKSNELSLPQPATGTIRKYINYIIDILFYTKSTILENIVLMLTIVHNIRINRLGGTVFIFSCTHHVHENHGAPRGGDGVPLSGTIRISTRVSRFSSMLAAKFLSSRVPKFVSNLLSIPISCPGSRSHAFLFSILVSNLPSIRVSCLQPRFVSSRCAKSVSSLPSILISYP
ncbi:hypothetical protein AGLY_013215 [Aphis glycines]|uniref:Uncharacterized protein n=1 Tax=Aphis glycines TaxID=307491 RepID=A0A6G0T5V1_APHGL|nr:hypothetical protein AGLY_013215 [Aphis glycines]